MPDTILNALEEKLDTHTVRSRLGPQWAEFVLRAGELATPFEDIISEDDPERAASYFEVAVNDLLDLCWEYEGIAELLDQAEADSLEFERDGLMRPPTSTAPDIVKIKEVANRYHSLLVQLKKTEQKRGR